MGGYWGINRTMAELHALLYLSVEPLCTDDIMDALQISRGNTSMNIRELVNWGLARRIHKKGDRKEYFVAETDVWEIFETIVRERRRREVEPIIETIERSRQMLDGARSQKGDRREDIEAYRERLDNMAEFLGTIMEIVNVLLTSGKDGFEVMRKLLPQMGKAS
jgi:DNA-binding transcriptional regulator GbsR (MarR family)